MGRFDINVDRQDGHDMTTWFLRARVAGLAVVHRDSIDCHHYDSVNEVAGVFRRVGWLVFDKTARRWSAVACGDASPTDLASLISAGVYGAETFGDRPGHLFRQKQWHAGVDAATGHPVAFASVAYRLHLQDLEAQAHAPLAIPETPDELLRLAGRESSETPVPPSSVPSREGVA